MSGVRRTKPSVAVLSDVTLFRRGLSELLRQQHFRRVTEYASTAELIAAARSDRPDVVVIDLDHERGDTMTVVRALRHELFDTHIVVIASAVRQGAADSSFDAEVETPTADVGALVTAVAAGAFDGRARRRSSESLRQHGLWSRLTLRQRDVLRWLATGADNRTIARKLRVGERAIKMHVSALLSLFGVQNRTQLALLADRAGLQPHARVRG